MPKCDICGKEPHVGNTVSHANNRNKRRFKPNLQRQKALVKGTVTHIRVCTRCIRAGKVTRPSVAAE